MDAAYFAQLLDMIKADTAKNPNLTIDAAYVAKLVDRFLD